MERGSFFPRLETIVSMCRAINNTQGQHFEQVSYTLVYTLHLTSTKDGRNKKKHGKNKKKEKARGSETLSFIKTRKIYGNCSELPRHLVSE